PPDRAAVALELTRDPTLEDHRAIVDRHGDPQGRLRGLARGPDREPVMAEIHRGHAHAVAAVLQHHLVRHADSLSSTSFGLTSHAIIVGDRTTSSLAASLRSMLRPCTGYSAASSRPSAWTAKRPL